MAGKQFFNTTISCDGELPVLVESPRKTFLEKYDVFIHMAGTLVDCRPRLA